MAKTHPFSPQDVVNKLTSEALTLRLVHIHGEYDDYYEIWYVPRWKQFKMNLEVSVWDGRGHESYKEKLDAPTLLERLEEMLNVGKVVSFYYEARG